MNENLKFRDMKTQTNFYTDKYEIRTKPVKGNPRRFAIADAPSGCKAWRVLPNIK